MKILLQTVKEYHQMMNDLCPNQLQMRFRNIHTGEDKQYGYVASYERFHYWYKTKKGAEAALLADITTMYPV